jgi:hypothetical protein
MNTKICAFTVCDANNQKYADIMVKMFKHFNPDIEIKVFGQEEVLKTADSDIFYRATPFFAKKLFNEGYDTIIKIDADNFIFGSLDLDTKERWDIGVVYNWNRTDPKKYGEVGIWDISPREYFNCGFVVMRNKRMVEHWWNLCNERNFLNYKFREQDLLNILCYYGDYEIKRLDDGLNSYGMLVKGENLRLELIDNQVILKKSADGYPGLDKVIKCYHVAGGNVPDNKLNYRVMFPEPIIKFIDNILK